MLLILSKSLILLTLLNINNNNNIVNVSNNRGKIKPGKSFIRLKSFATFQKKSIKPPVHLMTFQHGRPQPLPPPTPTHLPKTKSPTHPHPFTSPSFITSATSSAFSLLLKRKYSFLPTSTPTHPPPPSFARLRRREETMNHLPAPRLSVYQAWQRAFVGPSTMRG